MCQPQDQHVLHTLYNIIFPEPSMSFCYELKSLELGKRTNSYIRVNIRKLNKEPFTK